MNLNKAGLALIKEFEGYSASAYPDPATGGEPWTIGYGHTTAAGLPSVGPGLRITRDEAEAILKRDLAKTINHVRSMIKPDLTDDQFSALVSLAYNIGPGNFDGSTLLKKVNLTDYRAAYKEFAKWNKAGKPLKVMAGLTRRRAAEAELFMSHVARAVEPPAPVPLPPATTPAPKPIARPEPVPKPKLTLWEWLVKMFRGRS